MAGSYPISRAGTPSRRPTGSSDLMAGAGRPSNPNASLPGRTAAPSWRSISLGSGSPCTPMARPSSAKDMGPVKGAEHHRARCTTSPSRSRRPMPPNGRWRPSGNPSVSSSIATAGRHPRNPCPHRIQCPSPCRPMPGSASIRTIRPLFHGRPATTGVDLVTRDRAQGRRSLEVRPSADTSIIPASPGLVPAQIDKSVLAIAEPKRLRDKAHLRFVASQPCLVCGRQPSDPHHLRFAQPRALGLKVSDEFTVPLCRGHHRQLHQAGNEVAWWEDLEINTLEIAKGLWENRLKRYPIAAQAPQQQALTDPPEAAPRQDASKIPNEAN
jgi:hypothetical protein